MRNFVQALFVLVLAFRAGDALAADFYQIELVVFARPVGGNEEQSASAQALAYPLRLVTLQSAPADATSVGPFQLLPPAVRSLENESAALARRGFPILFHGAWRQGADTAERASGVAVTGGRTAGERRELEGYVTLSAENYLHVDVNLWLSQFGATDATSPETITLPAPPGSVVNPDVAPASINKLFVLAQHRRVRSGELHYFDHPRVSALILVKPVE